MISMLPSSSELWWVCCFPFVRLFVNIVSLQSKMKARFFPDTAQINVNIQILSVTSIILGFFFFLFFSMMAPNNPPTSFNDIYCFKVPLVVTTFRNLSYFFQVVIVLALNTKTILCMYFVSHKMVSFGKILKYQNFIFFFSFLDILGQ